MAFIGSNPKYNTSTYTPQSADPTSPVEGMVFRSDGTIRAKGLWEYKDSVFVQVGAAAGSLDIFHQDNFDATRAADMTSGNNATFDNGGSAAATPVDETSTPISGTNSLKYTQVAGSLNDWVASPVFSIDNKQSGNDYGMNIYGTYSGDSGDIAIVVYDDTNSVVFSSSLDVFTNESNPQRFNVSGKIPATAANLKWGFHVKVENIGAILVVDDIEFSSNPFQVANLLDNQEFTYDQNVTDIITTGGIEFNLSNMVEGGSGILTVSNVSSQTRWTANKDCVVDIHFSAVTNNLNAYWELQKNGTVVERGNSPAVSGRRSMLAGSIILEAGDYIAIGASSTTGIEVPSANVTLNVTAQAQSAHVVTPAKSSINSYSAVIGGGSATTAPRPVVTENVNWIDGDVTRNSVGNYTVNFVAGTFTVAPSITMTTEPNNYVPRIVSISPTSLNITLVNIGGNLVDNSVHIHAEAQGADVKDTTFLAAIPVIKDILQLTDGVTAPAAIVGQAQMYVDIADGDLKIIFGDGTIKTIVVDT